MQKSLPNSPSDGTVIVGMSGGVDSAVAALLLHVLAHGVGWPFVAGGWSRMGTNRRRNVGMFPVVNSR